MGNYLNPGNRKFGKAVNSEIYIDKSGLIAYTNKVINTTQQNICVSRPRRFGKSMAADMLTAYYSKGCESKKLFEGLKIEKDPLYGKYMNQYNVISLNMQEFISKTSSVQEMIERLKKFVTKEIREDHPEVSYVDGDDLAYCMQDVFNAYNCPFVVIIDEWDGVLREYKDDKIAQESYLDFLRDLLKDKFYIDLVYMTGILPIKKYGTHSALNMFSEFSMINPRQMAEFVGFTEMEVEELCEKYGMSESEVKNWYNGYFFENVGAIYSPKSVVEAVTCGICDTYWNQTETFEALKIYIDMNYDGLKDDVLSMMAGERIPINTGSFINDMTSFSCEDDVLTLLIHLGYLGYDFNNKCVYIPNREIRDEYISAVSVSNWGEVSTSLKNSADTLNAIWKNYPDQVAKGIAQAHVETSHLQYNDENALSYTISLALYAARNFYDVYREFPSGKGFADMVYIPRKKFSDKPAMIIELKWDKDVHGAIAQIRDKEYCECLKNYDGDILLVGINYDKKTKEHQCLIEKYVK